MARTLRAEPPTLNSASYNAARRSRSELTITETELRLMAAAAIMGDKRIPACILDVCVYKMRGEIFQGMVLLGNAFKAYADD